MINPEVVERIDNFGFNIDDIIVALLALSNDLNPSCISDDIKRQMNITGIVRRVYSLKGNDIEWKLPLFVEIENVLVEDDWEWVDNEFRKMFKQLSPTHAGDKQSCLTKMKKFMKINKGVTKEEILEATRMYLNGFTNGTQDIRYLQRANYFIFKSVPNSKDYQSRLSQYLEIVRDNSRPDNVLMRGLL